MISDKTKFNMKFLMFIVCAFTASNCAISHRIINGTEALPKPWVARIHFEHHGHLDSNCGGSLIHPEWILTAKHCLLETKTRLYSKKFYVYIGENERDYGQLIKVIEWHFYSTYNRGDNDVALLRLEKIPNKINRIPILLQDMPYKGLTAKIYGWGRTDPHNRTSSPKKLREAEVENLFPCYDDKICFHPTETNACLGDSGGPMTVKLNGIETLIGVSHAVSSNKHDVPCSGSITSYTSTAYYANWIQTIVYESLEIEDFEYYL